MNPERAEQLKKFREAGMSWAQISAELGLSMHRVKELAKELHRLYPQLPISIRAKKEAEWERGALAALEAAQTCDNIHDALAKCKLKRSTFDMRIHALRARGIDIQLPPGFYRDKERDTPRALMVAAVTKRLRAYAARAAKKGLNFDLDAQWVQDMYDRHKGMCFYSGVEMTVEPGMWQVTVDRINSAVGYEKSNCVLCCRAVNTAKSDLSLRDFAKLISLLYKRFKSVADNQHSS
ncbi:MAG: hypothetical protein E7G41_03075 [Bifidobacterium sp.]|nr:hypothetical protein [Bifidobacterium sp.]